MNSRLELDEILRELAGSNNVYYQPPESIQLKYPCLIYHLQDIDSLHANDKAYRMIDRYNITYITKKPDEGNIFSKKLLSRFILCRFDRWFASDNLNHYVFDLYF